MKRILILFLILLLSGCQQVNEKELKDEIKNEIKDEIMQEIQFQVTDFNNHLKFVSGLAKNCTVVVDVTMPDDSRSHGSGVVYDNNANDYYVLTNEHVIRYNKSLEVYLPNLDIYLSATLIKSDVLMDLAILKISSLEAISICSFKLVTFEVGELVLSVGTPVGYEYVNTVTLGIISRIENNLIQHDAAVNPGNSGGPLFNIEGDLIGLNVSKLNTTNSGITTVAVAGIGFSISVDIILEFIRP